MKTADEAGQAIAASAPSLAGPCCSATSNKQKRDRTLLQVTPQVARTMLAQRQAALVKKRGKLADDTAFGELCARVPTVAR